MAGLWLLVAGRRDRRQGMARVGAASQPRFRRVGMSAHLTRLLGRDARSAANATIEGGGGGSVRQAPRQSGLRFSANARTPS